MIWPSATTLSGCPAGTSGQVSVAPPTVTGDPGVSPAAARPSAEKLPPPPSRLPALVAESAVIPTLLKAALSDGQAMSTATLRGSETALPDESVNVAFACNW